MVQPASKLNIFMVALILCTSGLTNCGDHPSASLSPPVGEHDQKLEAFAGGHVRMVWCQHSVAGETDPFAISNRLWLVGLDTRDGKGERRVLSEAANYSRPILSADGKTILYTDKQTTRNGPLKSFDPVIYRTDWEGREPRYLANGYACDIWKDPNSQVEWVYAVQGLEPTTHLSLNGTRLVRFPLDAPERIEVVLDKTPLCPDNMQLSRSGRAMSVQSPWPKAGLLKFSKGGEVEFIRRDSGCWTALASDDSELLSICQGNHRDALMVRRDSTERWSLNLGSAGQVKGGEVYHPRWSNHARYVVLTGPYYLPVSDDSGSVIYHGGAEAQVIIGRLSEDARKVEEWCTASLGHGSTAFPDLWIEGGEESQLAKSAYDPRRTASVGPNPASRTATPNQ